MPRYVYESAFDDDTVKNYDFASDIDSYEVKPNDLYNYIIRLVYKFDSFEMIRNLPNDASKSEHFLDELSYISDTLTFAIGHTYGITKCSQNTVFSFPISEQIYTTYDYYQRHKFSYVEIDGVNFMYDDAQSLEDFTRRVKKYLFPSAEYLTCDIYVRIATDDITDRMKFISGLCHVFSKTLESVNGLSSYGNFEIVDNRKVRRPVSVDYLNVPSTYQIKLINQLLFGDSTEPTELPLCVLRSSRKFMDKVGELQKKIFDYYKNLLPVRIKHNNIIIETDNNIPSFSIQPFFKNSFDYALESIYPYIKLNIDGKRASILFYEDSDYQQNAIESLEDLLKNHTIGRIKSLMIRIDFHDKNAIKEMQPKVGCLVFNLKGVNVGTIKCLYRDEAFKDCIRIEEDPSTEIIDDL